MKFTEVFSGLSGKNAIGLLIVAAGMLAVGKPLFHLLGQGCELLSQALPVVGK